MEKWGLSDMVGRKVIWQLLIKLNTVTMWPSNSTSKHILKRNKNISPHKNLSTMLIQGLFIIGKKQETIQISINWWINKQMAIKRDEVCWHMLQHGWTLKILCWVKEVNHRRSHIKLFHLYEMSRRGKSTEAEWISGG